MHSLAGETLDVTLLSGGPGLREAAAHALAGEPPMHRWHDMVPS